MELVIEVIAVFLTMCIIFAAIGAVAILAWILVQHVLKDDE